LAYRIVQEAGEAFASTALPKVLDNIYMPAQAPNVELSLDEIVTPLESDSSPPQSFNPSDWDYFDINEISAQVAPDTPSSVVSAELVPEGPMNLEEFISLSELVDTTAVVTTSQDNRGGESFLIPPHHQLVALLDDGSEQVLYDNCSTGVVVMDSVSLSHALSSDPVGAGTAISTPPVHAHRVAYLNFVPTNEQLPPSYDYHHLDRRSGS
jgi:hypothetical protein